MRICYAAVARSSQVYAIVDILIERNNTVCPSFVRARILMKYSKFDGLNNPITISASIEAALLGMIDLYLLATRDAKTSKSRSV